MAKDKSGRCSLCQREVLLTFHHLIPKKVHRRPYFKKTYAKADLNQGIWVCRLCHNGIHDHYDEMTLAKRLQTLKKIQTDPQLQRHAAWVAKQKVRA